MHGNVSFLELGAPDADTSKTQAFFTVVLPHVILLPDASRAMLPTPFSPLFGSCFSGRTSCSLTP